MCPFYSMVNTSTYLISGADPVQVAQHLSDVLGSEGAELTVGEPRRQRRLTPAVLGWRYVCLGRYRVVAVRHGGDQRGVLRVHGTDSLAVVGRRQRHRRPRLATPRYDAGQMLTGVARPFAVARLDHARLHGQVAGTLFFDQLAQVRIQVDRERHEDLEMQHLQSQKKARSPFQVSNSQ